MNSHLFFGSSVHREVRLYHSTRLRTQQHFHRSAKWILDSSFRQSSWSSRPTTPHLPFIILALIGDRQPGHCPGYWFGRHSNSNIRSLHHVTSLSDKRPHFSEASVTAATLDLLHVRNNVSC